MGRWSQAKRSGGGIPLPNFIIAATTEDVETIQLTYNKPIDALTLDPTAFTALPPSEIADSIVQVAANAINLIFLADITATTSIVYTGTTPAILSPQTFAY